MEKDEIKDYIEKLKRLQKEITNDEDGYDEDFNFIGDLDKLLKGLSNDIQESYGPQTVKLPVRIKKLVSNAVIPTYSKDGDAGMDLTATSKEYDKDGNIVYGIGLAFEIPKGFVGLLFPRSSNAKKDLLLTNSVGVLDSGYRGEVMLKYKPSARFQTEINTNKIAEYDVGDRVGQILIIPYPQIEFIESEELSTTERNSGGFGHTGS